MKRRVYFMLVSVIVALTLAGCGHQVKFLVVNYTNEELTVSFGEYKSSPSIPAKGHAYLYEF